MSKHIVLVHRYFAPDTPPYATILRDLAQHLAGRGNRVTVLTCQPSYNRDVVDSAPRQEYLAPGLRVIRWPVLDDRKSAAKKVANLIWFCLRLLGVARRLGQVDAMMAASTPPVLVAAVVQFIARRKHAAFLYHKQDIYPEVTVGLRRDLGPIGRLLRQVDARTDRRSHKVIVLSQDMAATIEQRGVAPQRLAVINNFDPWQLGTGEPARPARRRHEALDVVFAGNLGRFQGLETLFTAITALRGEPFRFHFFGHGALLGDLQQLVVTHDLNHVEVHGYRPPDEVAAFLQARADLGVVCLAPGVIRAAYPSKTLSYLRQGTPILALVESDSELARMVRAERIGIQVEPGDHDGLVAALREACSEPSLLAEAPGRMRALFEQEFSRQVRLAQWDAVLEDVC